MIWSAEVMILSYIPNGIMPFAVSSMTNLIGAALLFMCFFRKIKGEIRKEGKAIVLRCAMLAVLYFVYNVMFIYVWKNFDPLTGSYTISTTVVLMPLLLFLMRKKIGVKMLISSALIGAGIVIAFTANEGQLSMQSLLIVLGAAFLRGLFYIRLNDTAKEYDSITVSTLIILFSGIVSHIAWTVMQPTTFFAVPWSKQAVAGLFVHAYFVTVAAQTLNIFAQRRTTASSATIIYALESVFATLLCVIMPASVAGDITLTLPRIAAVVFVVLGNLVDLFKLPGEDREEEQEKVSEKKPQPALDVMSLDAGKKALMILALFVIYFIFSIPFKALDIMPGFTDIRPVTVLHPIYGIFFGIPGCAVLGIGNLISDVIGGSLRISSAAGAAANFIGPLLFYVFWSKISKTSFCLRTWKDILKFAGTVIVVAVTEMLIITPFVAYFYPGTDYMRFAVIVLCNTAIFPIALGVPLTVLIQEEFGFRPVRLQRKA